MTILQSIILGIIQGLTEFLPVSSSAHLVLAPYFFGWTFPSDQVMPFDVLVQLGTLLAVIIYFWRDLWTIIKAFLAGLIHKKPFEDPQARMGWYIILATIPAGLAGMVLKKLVDQAFHSVSVTALFLLVTAVILIGAEWVGKKTRPLESLTWKDALWIGIAQIISIFPGVSRSGATIAGGMTRHLDRSSAARFSFLMSIPIMLAAGLLGVLDLNSVENLSGFLPVLAAGFVAAFGVGMLTIHLLLNYLRRRPLTVFAVYCAAAGLVTLLVVYVS